MLNLQREIVINPDNILWSFSSSHSGAKGRLNRKLLTLINYTKSRAKVNLILNVQDLSDLEIVK